MKQTLVLIASLGVSIASLMAMAQSQLPSSPTVASAPTPDQPSISQSPSKEDLAKKADPDAPGTVGTVQKPNRIPGNYQWGAGETEGTLFKDLFGGALERRTGIMVGDILEVGASENNIANSTARNSGAANYPICVPPDNGVQLNDVELLIHKDMRTDIFPRIFPLPGAVPKQFAWGFYSETMYGRSSQGARMYGWDMNWHVNDPGDYNSTLGTQIRENYLSTPHVIIQAYIPWLNGIGLTFGRFASAIGWEFAPPVRPSPDPLYSHDYAFQVQPLQVFGFLASFNVVRDSRIGYLAAEFGVNNGQQTVWSVNGSKAYQTAIRWGNRSMSTGINYESLIGDAQVPPGPKQTQYMPIYKVISPTGQLRMYHSLNGFHNFSPNWRVTAEIEYGKQFGDGKADTVLIGPVPGAGPGFKGAFWGGINGQLIYKRNKTTSYILRLEQFRDPDGFALYPFSAVKSTFNDVTNGVNWNVTKYVNLRPEVRYDFQSANQGAAFGLQNANGKPYTYQTTASMDMEFYF